MIGYGAHFDIILLTIIDAWFHLCGLKLAVF